ncbi:AraC family transcriptional regulator [Altericroceibacterium spongiae]|nr:helix-turn-helix transcriptional regulator [Altericroceibacterium spongiae]
MIVAMYDAQAEHRELGKHSHARGQLSGLRNGLLTIGTDTGAWVIPAEDAVWLPPHHPHYGWTHGAVEGWSCYIAEADCTDLPAQPRTIRCSGLLREAVLRASEWQGHDLSEEQDRVAMVILDELRTAPVEPFGLPMPSDPRLLLVARALLDDPGKRWGVDEWARWAGISERTLSRRFVAETGFTYTTWRQRARLMRALEMVAEGEAVTNVAFDLGYDSVSAFIALFKRTLGVTPSVYFQRP